MDAPRVDLMTPVRDYNKKVETPGAPIANRERCPLFSTTPFLTGPCPYCGQGSQVRTIEITAPDFSEDQVDYVKKLALKKYEE